MQSLEDFCSKIQKNIIAKDNITIASYTIKIDNFGDDYKFISGFSNMDLFPRIYWSDMADCKIIGFGCVREYISNKFEHDKLNNFITSIRNSAISNIENQELLKVFGGLAFNQIEEKMNPLDVWGKFPKAYFFLPQIMISNIDKKYYVTYNISLSQKGSNLIKEEFIKLISQFNSLQQNLENNLPNMQLTHINKQFSSQSFKQWKHNISKIKLLIENSPLEKLVLANSKIFHLTKPINIDSSLIFLHKNYPNANIFAFEIVKSNILISATPELLIQKSKNQLKTVALAGSRGRGENDDEDLQFENDLLSSKKDLREHKFVVDQILKKFRNLGIENIKLNKSYVVKLKNIQHLKAEITATSNTSLPNLIQALHPTAAVGGVPTAQAWNIIKSMENIDRGWYASPVGWINIVGDGKFVVAIRSAFITDQKAVMYAGAGIVSDSDASAEWNEIDIKFQPMLRAIGAVRNTT